MNSSCFEVRHQGFHSQKLNAEPVFFGVFPDRKLISLYAIEQSFLGLGCASFIFRIKDLYSREWIAGAVIVLSNCSDTIPFWIIRSAFPSIIKSPLARFIKVHMQLFEYVLRMIYQTEWRGLVVGLIWLWGKAEFYRTKKVIYFPSARNNYYLVSFRSFCPD